MKRVFFILMILVISLINCKSKEKINEKVLDLNNNFISLKLVEEKSIKLDVVTKDMPGIAKIDDDFIYITFLNLDKNMEIWKYNDNLEFQDKFILKYGHGPGEVINPRIYGGGLNNILIYDPPSYKYNLYDKNFKFIKQYRLSDLGTFLYYGYKYIPEHNCILDAFYTYVSKSKTGMKAVIKIYLISLLKEKTKNKEIFNITIDKFKNYKSIVAYPVHFTYFDKYIYILNTKEYKIYKMDIKGKLIKNIKVKFKGKRFTENEIEKWIESHYGSKYKNRFLYPEELWPACWIMPLGKGIAVGRRKDYNTNRNEPIIVDYFDKDLNFIGKIKLSYFKYWNDPNGGQQFADILFNCKGDIIYRIKIEAKEDEEEYSLIKFKVKYGKE